MPDYSSVVVGIAKELIGVAASFIPATKVDDKVILTDLETAEVNTERIKLVRVMLDEVKEDTKCPSCRAHVDKAMEEVAWLEKEVPRVERVAALRQNLKNLLEEAQQEMNSTREPSTDLEPLLEEKKEIVPEVVSPKEKITTDTAKVKSACVPCAIGHFTTSAKLLAEAVRFKNDGLVSPQVMDDIAEAIAEQNALERIDLTPAKIKDLPESEKKMASEALSKSRELRHKLESVKDMDQLEAYAAETEEFYKKLNRSWISKRLEKQVLNPETTTNT